MPNTEIACPGCQSTDLDYLEDQIVRRQVMETEATTLVISRASDDSGDPVTSNPRLACLECEREFPLPAGSTITWTY